MSVLQTMGLRCNIIPWMLSVTTLIGILGCSATTVQPASAEHAVSTYPLPINGQASSNVSAISPQAQQLPITLRAVLNTHSIDLEVAVTPMEQAIGLMHRTHLDDNRGMLFPFSPPRPVNFWMHNVKIELDMLFIADNTIVAIASQAPPCDTELCPTYGPDRTPVDYVLELRGGRATELGLQIGDPVQFVPVQSAAGDPHGATSNEASSNGAGSAAPEEAIQRP